ncbi:hypothetical protein SUGI_1181320 [Cryptomeria japonica]|nr:hypothetical protein SUGI_1181320 [Cryptomeria japonica]
MLGGGIQLASSQLPKKRRQIDSDLSCLKLKPWSLSSVCFYCTHLKIKPPSQRLKSQKLEVIAESRLQATKKALFCLPAKKVHTCRILFLFFWITKEVKLGAELEKKEADRREVESANNDLRSVTIDRIT